MDRNNLRSSYINSGPRSLPHIGNKRHNGNGHPGARLSPPAPTTVNIYSNNNNNHNSSNNSSSSSSQHDDLINYIYDAWNKVTRELERGSKDAKYYQEMPSHQLGNFRPFNLDEWWGRRLIQSINRNKHRS